MAEIVTPTATGARLRLRVRPGAGRDAVLGRTRLADGEPALLVAVSAPPEDGKANAAVIQLLAKAWRLPKSSLSIGVGAAARNKLLDVAGESRDLVPHLIAWLADLPEK
jgi:uncharacterized protein YggU (UPF0235/DUF167 family)